MSLKYAINILSPHRSTYNCFVAAMFRHAKITLFNFKSEELFCKLYGIMHLHGKKIAPERRDSSFVKARSRLSKTSRLPGTGWFLHVIRNVFFDKKYYLNGILSKYRFPAKRDKLPHNQPLGWNIRYKNFLKGCSGHDMQKGINLVVFVLVSIFFEWKTEVQKVYPSFNKLLLICFQNQTSYEIETRFKVTVFLKRNDL